MLKILGFSTSPKCSGTAIADFLYSLGGEVGVAWLRNASRNLQWRLHPLQRSEIVGVQGLSQHVTVGFNQWDEEWEEGTIDDSTVTCLTSSITQVSVAKTSFRLLPNDVLHGYNSPKQMWMTEFYYDEN